MRVPAGMCPQSKTTAKIRRQTSGNTLIHYHVTRSTQHTTPASTAITFLYPPQPHRNSKQTP